jgi:hypothetical protein
MLKRLDLERKFHRLSDEMPDQHREKTAISRMLWGLHISDGVCSYSYLQPSLLPSPTIPPPLGYTHWSEEGMNVDFIGRPFTETSPQPPFVPGIFRSCAEIAEKQYRMILYNIQTKNELGSDQDLSIRRTFYYELMDWQVKLPRHFRPDVNFTPETCFLFVHFHETIIGVIRPLHLDTIVIDGHTVKDLCLRYCAIDVANMEQYQRMWPYREFSGMIFPGPYNAIISMTPWLDDPRTHDTFTRAAALLAYPAKELAMPRTVLRAVRALTGALKQRIPFSAQRYFMHIDREADDAKDVPMSFVLPDQEVLRELLTDEVQERTKLGAQLGALISKWNTMSLQ